MDEWNQWEDLSEEREEELINSIADFFSRKGLGMLALMSLESGGNLTSMFADFWMGLYGPYLDFLQVDEHIALLRKKSNVKKLIERLEQLEGKK
jgi:hypothetical protein